MDNVFVDAYSSLTSSNNQPIDMGSVLNYSLSNAKRLSPMWHALGFVHCKLFEGKSGTLRLHIWPENKRDDKEQAYKVHDHIFSLISHVVCGRIDNKEYNLIQRAAKSSDDFQLYDVKYTASGSVLEPSAQCYGLECTRVESKTAGMTYGVKRGTFHQSEVNRNELTATLVATYDHSMEDPKMLGTLSNRSPVFRERVGFPSDEWCDLLEILKNKL